jgi:hypothetical protein
MRGTLLNTATVAVGGSLGLLVGNRVPADYKQLAFTGLGLVTVGIGIKLFLESKNILITAAGLVLGGILGLALGLAAGFDNFAETMKHVFHGGGNFTEGLITASVLFCVGPMTLLGCLEDGLEGKSELLQLKSTMDGFAAFFFAVTLGAGVLVSALVVLVFQGALTLLATPLRPVAKDTELIAEISAVGGTMMMAIGLKLLDIKSIPVADFLPSLAVAPLLLVVGRRVSKAMHLGKSEVV